MLDGLCPQECPYSPVNQNPEKLERFEIPVEGPLLRKPRFWTIEVPEEFLCEENDGFPTILFYIFIKIRKKILQ